MSPLMFGPAFDYELAYRRERIGALWGPPSWGRGLRRRDRSAQEDPAQRDAEPAAGTQRKPALPRSQVWPAA